MLVAFSKSILSPSSKATYNFYNHSSIIVVDILVTWLGIFSLDNHAYARTYIQNTFNTSILASCHDLIGDILK